HVESVAWVSERKDVLSTLFWMLTLLAYWRYTRQPRLRRYLPVLVLLALGLMAKPMLVTLPLVMLLLDVWPLGRLPLARSPGAPAGTTAPGVERSARRQDARPGGDPGARCRLLPGHLARPSPALAPGGLALVRGDAAAGDRAGPGRRPGHGRPLHLCAAHRTLHHARLERRGDRPTAAGLEIDGR